MNPVWPPAVSCPRTRASRKPREAGFSFPGDSQGVEFLSEPGQFFPDRSPAGIALFLVGHQNVKAYALVSARLTEMLEINEGTVKVRLHRPRAALKKLLEPVLGEGGR